MSNKPTRQYATSFLQSLYYGLTIRAGQPRPPPQSPRYQRHRRRIYIVVIVGYLLYTLLETFRQVQRDGDFYEVLEVSPFAEERTIKSRFRKLAAQHHPDKAGFASDSDAYFIFLRGAQETLVDPVKRFAYDRFGPDMQNWGPQKTMRDYIMTSITRSILPQYFGGMLVMFAMNWFWWSNRGRYVSLSPRINMPWPNHSAVALLHLGRDAHARAIHHHPPASRVHARSLPPRRTTVLDPRRNTIPTSLPDPNPSPSRRDHHAHFHLPDWTEY